MSIPGEFSVNEFSPQRKSRFGHWKTVACAVFAALTLGFFAAGPSFATETNWSNLENWNINVTSDDSPSAVEWAGNNQMTVWRGVGVGTTQLWYSLNGGPATRISDGASQSAPTVVFWQGAPTVLHRAAAPFQNHILYSRFDILSRTWSRWIDLDLNPSGERVLTSSTPVATTIQGGNVMEVAWQGTDDHMYLGAAFTTNNGATLQWIGQGEIAGAGLTRHSPAIATLPVRNGRDGLPREGLLLVHTGEDEAVYYSHAYVNVARAANFLSVEYDLPDDITGRIWQPIVDQNTGIVWQTDSRPTVATNAQNRSIIRVGMRDLDGNLAYIGGTNIGRGVTDFGSWQIEHSRSFLASPPMLYNNTDTGEIDAIGFLSGSFTNVLRVMRCD
jgi:hypothetical protein